TVTQAAEFVSKNPTFDGRGTTIAIIDTGVDAGAKGLQVTSEGKRKVVDYIDCTGAGDVKMGPAQTCTQQKPLELVGDSGRVLRLNPKWNNPSGQWRVGSKWFYDIAPPSVKRDVQKERHELFKKQSKKVADEIDAEKKKPEASADIREQSEVLKTLDTMYSDCGPLLDCIIFHDGKNWKAAIDTSETGDFTEAPAMGAYKDSGDSALLNKRHLLYFTINFYDNADILSIVTCSGEHGTHVAGIAAAYHPDEPENSGVAPGAQILSMMIGDHRVDSMETGVGLTRAAMAIIEHNVDLANMSFGEPTARPNSGQWVDLIREEVVRRHRCTFVASAGNSGPALSTLGAPGGTTDSVISVGAHVDIDQMKAHHSTMTNNAKEGVFNWSSRGPSPDGARGVDVYAPGGAITSFPSFSKMRLTLLNGTSMSTPNVCGTLALLVSAWKQTYDQNIERIHPGRLRNAILATSKDIGDELGAGLIQTEDAWVFLQKYAKRTYEDIGLSVSVAGSSGMRGIYLRNAQDSDVPRTFSLSVTPNFLKDPNDDLEKDTDGSYGNKKSQMLFDYEQRIVLQSTASWVCHRNAEDLEKLKSMHLLVDSKISSMRLSVSSTLASAFTSTVSGKVAIRDCLLKNHIPLFVKTDAKPPANASPGDVLLGELTLSSDIPPVNVMYIVSGKGSMSVSGSTASSSLIDSGALNGASSLLRSSMQSIMSLVSSQCGGLSLSELSVDKTNGLGEQSISAAPEPVDTGNGETKPEDNAETKPDGPEDKERKALEKEMEQAMHKMRVGWIKKANSDLLREQLVSELIESAKTDSERLSIMLEHLGAIDTSDKQAMPWSAHAGFTEAKAARTIEVADKIIEMTEETVIKNYYYTKVNLTSATAEERKLKKDADEANGHLVVALKAKCRAAAFLAGKSLFGTESVENLDDAIKKYKQALEHLERWEACSDYSSVEIMALRLPLLIAEKKYAQSLKHVLAWLSSAAIYNSNSDMRRKMVELRDQLLGKLGWSLWIDHFSTAARAQRPKEYVKI
ncbi:hypothetical protein LPJ53_005665, partial [Coemansia erecta]